jgi:hypothetical protein
MFEKFHKPYLFSSMTFKKYEHNCTTPVATWNIPRRIETYSYALSDHTGFLMSFLLI